MKIVLMNQFQSEQSREWIFRQTMCGVGHMNCTGHMSFMETWLYGPCGLHGTLWLYGIHRLVDTPELNILIASDKCEVWEQMWCMGHMWFLWHMWCRGHIWCMGHMWCMEHIVDIWWKNYCVDEQTSTHPTQITV